MTILHEHEWSNATIRCEECGGPVLFRKREIAAMGDPVVQLDAWCTVDTSHIIGPDAQRALDQSKRSN